MIQLELSFVNKIMNMLLNIVLMRKLLLENMNWYDLITYYNVGKMLSEAGKHYGEGIINEYSSKLSIDIGKGYGPSNLKRMRQFYYMIEKGVAMPHQLSWSHVLMILPLDDINEINYYIDITINNNIGYC